MNYADKSNYRLFQLLRIQAAISAAALEIEADPAGPVARQALDGIQEAMNNLSALNTNYRHLVATSRDAARKGN